MLEDTYRIETTSQSSHRSWAVPIIGVGLIVVGGFTAYQGAVIENLQRDVTAYQQDNATLRSGLASLEKEVQKKYGSLRGEVSTARQETTGSLSKVQDVAQAAARQQTAAMAGELTRKQQEREALLTAEISRVKESATQTSTKLDGISTEVGSVKTEVASAKATAERTLADLQRVRGDLGVMSGLIATNAKEVQILRTLGDRNIYEFTLAKSAGRQRIGDIAITLRKADPAHNRYTVEVIAADKRVEKRDKAVNEPVQFYTAANARQPYELVINQVRKDAVSGYLATPKALAARK